VRLPDKLHLYKLDLLDQSQTKGFISKIKTIFTADSTIGFVYCCGKWQQGKIDSLDENETRQTIAINLIEPIFFTKNMLQAFYQPMRFMFLTGMSVLHGVNGGSVYNICTTGIRIFVKTLAEEVATRKETYCVCLSLGLYDKGQQYYNQMAEDLRLPNHSSLNDVAEYATRLLKDDLPLVHGTVLELTNGVTDYSKIIGWFNK
jgi:NAD(P)-dependent dehydrogenase (short-subunit alcohol dehydrogenase family)